MALPKQVQKQIKKSAEIHEKVYNPSEDEAKKPELKEVQAEETGQPEPLYKTDTGPMEEPPEEAQPEETWEEVTSDVTKPRPVEDWEQKYKVIQGKYDAEKPQLERQVKTLESQLVNMQQLIANMQQPVAPKEEDTAAPGGTRRLVSSEEVDDYGEDLIDVVGRRAQEVMSPELRKMQQEIMELRSKLGGVETATAQTRQERVHAVLDSKIEDWQALNNDANFLNWLDQLDPYSGEVRRELLQRAYAAGDADRVVRFFNGFRNEHAAMSAPSEPSAAPARAPKIDTEDLVQPGKARAASSGTPKGKRTWSRAEISGFFSDVRKGKYRSDPDKQRAIEADILAASREGRVR